MRRTRNVLIAAAFAALVGTAAASLHAATSVMLPNGWHVTPAGTLTGLGTLPLHMAEDPSGRWIAVTHAGYGDLSIAMLDAESGRLVSSQPISAAFYGLAFSGPFLYATTANGDTIQRFRVARDTGALSPAGSIVLGRGDLWLSGLAATSGMLFAAEMDADQLVAVDAGRGGTVWTVKVGKAPYAVVLSPDEQTAYVSDWASASVSVVDVRHGRLVKTIAVGPHPNAELLSKDGTTLFVACANDDTVAEIDTQRGTVRKTIAVGIYPHALAGAIPNGLALSPYGNTLFVADGGENAVVAVDLTTSEPAVFGAIPTGWFPTDVVVSESGHKLFVLDGKGTAVYANPEFPHLDILAHGTHRDHRWYDAALQTGDLEMLDLPKRVQLVNGLAAVRLNSPYSPQRSAGQVPTGMHVIYIIKENRTYDEVLGDDPRGNGDPSLTIFGRRITPNIHRIANTFVLLDNFDTDSTVSADGHNWSTAAYASDWVEKLWPASYSDRRETYDYEERGPASPQAGYLWNDALDHGVSLRDYGEFVKFGADKPPFQPSDPTLQGHLDPTFRGFDLHHSDQERLDEWLREFQQYVASGSLPQLEIVRLPNDHTAATLPGYKTPYAMVADNDYAVGRLVEAVSHSRFWATTVIFSVEDDAQAGPDHVSDHRAAALIAGGPIKRGLVDHTHYTTSSVLRTIELLLHLPPMSQFDAGATPMLDDLAATVDATPYTAIAPLVNLNDVNSAADPDAKTSQALDFTHADAADPQTTTAILFRFAHSHKP